MEPSIRSLGRALVNVASGDLTFHPRSCAYGFQFELNRALKLELEPCHHEAKLEPVWGGWRGNMSGSSSSCGGACALRLFVAKFSALQVAAQRCRHGLGSAQDKDSRKESRRLSCSEARRQVRCLFARWWAMSIPRSSMLHCTVTQPCASQRTLCFPSQLETMWGTQRYLPPWCVKRKTLLNWHADFQVCTTQSPHLDLCLLFHHRILRPRSWAFLLACQVSSARPPPQFPKRCPQTFPWVHFLPHR